MKQNMNAFFSSQKMPRANAFRAFTLVELLIVVAIIGILGAVALPAYNNYSLKSKFSEVVLATAPTKTAISACAVSGDCVVSDAIALGVAGVTSSAAPVIATTTATRPSDALLYAAYAATFIPGQGDSRGRQLADNAVHSSTTIRLIPAPSDSSKVCVSTATPFAACTYSILTVAQVAAYMSAAQNPYYVDTTVTVGGGVIALPCVGASSGCSPATKYAASVGYDSSGVITGTAAASAGLNGETFILTPAYSAGRVDWSASGSCKTRAGGALC